MQVILQVLPPHHLVKLPLPSLNLTSFLAWLTVHLKFQLKFQLKFHAAESLPTSSLEVPTEVPTEEVVAAVGTSSKCDTNN